MWKRMTISLASILVGVFFVFGYFFINGMYSQSTSEESILSTGVILSLMPQAALAQEHDHHKGHGKKASKSQAPTKKFEATEDLKVRMEKILAVMKGLHDKKNDPKLVVEAGNNVTAIVQDIIKTCELAPDADAAIHPALGQILEGAEDFKKGKYDIGHEKIHQALLDYEKLFVHKGWKH